MKTEFGDGRMGCKVLSFKTFRLSELHGKKCAKIEMIFKVETERTSNSIDDKVHLLLFHELIPSKHPWKASQIINSGPEYLQEFFRFSSIVFPLSYSS